MEASQLGHSRAEDYTHTILCIPGLVKLLWVREAAWDHRGGKLCNGDMNRVFIHVFPHPVNECLLSPSHA